MPRIFYEFANPKRTLLESRFAPLFLLNDVQHKSPNTSPARVDDDESNLNASAIPFFPLSTVLSKIAAKHVNNPNQSPAWSRFQNSEGVEHLMDVIKSQGEQRGWA